VPSRSRRQAERDGDHILPTIVRSPLLGRMARKVVLCPVLASLCVAALSGAVISAVHHAEVVAHRLGEPFGTLVLTVSITIIEVGPIVMLMLGAEADKAALPRDTIFASIMIICNAVVGLCLLTAEGAGAVGSNLRGRLDHPRVGPHPCAARCDSPGDLRCFRIPRVCPVTRQRRGYSASRG
jgi:hypothetical protein